MTKWIITMCMMFVACTLVNGWIEMEYLGNANAGVLYTLFTGYQEIEFTNAFFYGYWEIFRYIFICISIGFTVSMILAVRGTSSS
jgi:hypothetical protein